MLLLGWVDIGFNGSYIEDIKVRFGIMDNWTSISSEALSMTTLV